MEILKSVSARVFSYSIVGILSGAELTCVYGENKLYLCKDPKNLYLAEEKLSVPEKEPFIVVQFHGHDWKHFKKTLGNALPKASDRTTLAGLLFNFSAGGFQLVSSDARRIHIQHFNAQRTSGSWDGLWEAMKAQWPDIRSRNNEGIEFILPTAFLKTLKPTRTMVIAYSPVTARMILVEDHGDPDMVKVIDTEPLQGMYPGSASIVKSRKEEEGVEVTFRKSEIDRLKMFKGKCDPDTNKITISGGENGVRASCTFGDENTLISTTEAVLLRDPVDQEFSFTCDHRHLLSVLEGMVHSITVQFSLKSDSPAYLKSGDFSALLMPIRS